MTTNAINSIGVVGNPKIAFKKEVEENVEKKEIQSEDKSSMLVVGLAAAAALGVAGFMIAKGRGGRAGEQGQEALEEVVTRGKEVLPKKTKPVKKVEIFPTKDGGKNKLVTVTNPDGKITRTTNFYDKDGNLTKVTVKGGENGWAPVSTTTFLTKGNLKMSETTYNNGKSIKKVVKDAAGNIKSKKYIKLDDSGNVVSETYIKKFDKSGQPLEKRIITYNKEQKIEKFLVKENNVWKEVSAAKSVGAKVSPDDDISEFVSKMTKKGLEERKKEAEKVLKHFPAAERKMLENLQDLIGNSKIGEALELAKSIPSRVVTRMWAVAQEVFGKEKIVSEVGEELKFLAGKICKENGELFTGKIAKNNTIVKNGLVKAMEIDSEVIKFKG